MCLYEFFFQSSIKETHIFPAFGSGMSCTEHKEFPNNYELIQKKFSASFAFSLNLFVLIDKCIRIIYILYYTLSSDLCNSTCSVKQPTIHPVLSNTENVVYM